jgi:hypothetical protein
MYIRKGMNMKKVLLTMLVVASSSSFADYNGRRLEVNRDDPNVHGANEQAGAKVIAENKAVRDVAISAAAGAVGGGLGRVFGSGPSTGAMSGAAGAIIKGLGGGK